MTGILLAVACTLLARQLGRFLLLLIGRSTPAMHRLMINAMRRRVREECELFEEKHGADVDDVADDPIDHPEDYR